MYKDKYWEMYTELIDNKCFYSRYLSYSKLLSSFFNGFLYVFSFGGIASWIVWKQYPGIWAIVLAVSQIAYAIRDILPFSKQISAIKLFKPELNDLINDVDHDWCKVNLNSLTDAEIIELEYAYRKRFNILEQKYLNDVNFRNSQKIINNAMEDRKLYFFRHFNITEVEKFEEKEVKHR